MWNTIRKCVGVDRYIPCLQHNELDRAQHSAPTPGGWSASGFKTSANNSTLHSRDGRLDSRAGAARQSVCVPVYGAATSATRDTTYGSTMTIPNTMDLYRSLPNSKQWFTTSFHQSRRKVPESDARSLQLSLSLTLSNAVRGWWPW